MSDNPAADPKPALSQGLFGAIQAVKGAISETRVHLRGWWITLGSRVRDARDKARGAAERAVKRTDARLRLRSSNLWNRFRLAIARNMAPWFWACVLAYTATTYLLYTPLSDALSPVLDASLEGRLADLLLNVGAALTGASAIVFSLILFAIQANIERMPYGLFRSLTLDFRLLGAFAGTFALSLLVAVLSLLISHRYATAIVVTAFWAAFLTLLLFVFAYGRAIELTNPRNQLQMMVRSTTQRLSASGSIGRLAAILWAEQQSEKTKQAAKEAESTHDMGLVRFFAANRDWDKPARESVAHAMAYARSLAQKGDHDVARAALAAIVQIAAGYVSIKGKTFFHENPLFQTGLSRDGFINDCLELIRQNVRHGLTSSDEEFLEQLFRTLGQLCQLFSQIDYSHPRPELTHAHLASGYLGDAVRDAAQHNMPDVVMEGVRALAQCARRYIDLGHPNDVRPLVERIGQLGAISTASEGGAGVSVIALGELGDLTLWLLRSDGDVKFAIEHVRRQADLIAAMFMATPLSKQMFADETYLGPYYSFGVHDGFPQKLTALANALIGEPAASKDAERVIRNIADWAEDHGKSLRELLSKALKNQAPFSTTIVSASFDFARLVMAISHSDACPDHVREKLVDGARRLLSILSWVPPDPQSIHLLESIRPAESLFEAGLEARRRSIDGLVEIIPKLLIEWGLKASAVPGWASLQTSLEAAAVFALLAELPEGALLFELRKALASNRPSAETIDAAVRDLLEAADKHPGELSTSLVERMMAHVDSNKRRELIHALASALHSVRPPRQRL